MELFMMWLMGFGCGIFTGMWFGLKAYAAQRNAFDAALGNMARDVKELSIAMHDGRLTPDVVLGWIASIRTMFPPARRR